MTDANTTKPARKRVRKMAREPQAEGSTQPVETTGGPNRSEKPKTKAELVLELLQRAGGATLDELVGATGWLPHTTRAALTGLRKKGHALTSEKTDGVRRYRIAMPQADAGATQ